MKTIFFQKSLAAATVLALASTASAKDYLAFFGTYTNALSKGIYVSRLDEATGKLSAPELAAETPSPAYVTFSPGDKFLYAGNEASDAVSAFSVDAHSGRLTLLNQKSSSGAGPCHLSTDAKGGALLVANYNGGNLKSFSLNHDGSIGADASVIQHHGSSVNEKRQTAPHAHFICADPGNHFALACDLGLDKILVYKLNPATGELTESSFSGVPPGSGPRHLAFSHDGKFAFVVNEMGCSITTFTWDAKTGTLTPVETVSALPPGVTAKASDTGAEIRVSGNHVYATIRGMDTVSVLTADPQTGQLTFLQNVSAVGKMPRGMGIDPEGRWLLIGNQKTDSVVEFAIDPQTGKLSPTGQELKIGAPVDVNIIEAK